LQSPKPPHWTPSSAVHAVLLRVQCRVAYGASEQSTPIGLVGLMPQPLLLPATAPEPALPLRLRVVPGQLAMPNCVSPPSGFALDGVAVLPPPPT
jgi:hypothetical protein